VASCHHRTGGQSQGHKTIVTVLTVTVLSTSDAAHSHLCTRISLLHDDMQLADIVCSGALRRDSNNTICVAISKVSTAGLLAFKYFGK